MKSCNLDCDCDIGGSVRPVCDKISGQCPCQSRVTGRTCKEPLQAHFFPALYQYQYEVENGHTPADSAVRYAYDEAVFPGYSWKGYAVFSLLQVMLIYLTSLAMYFNYFSLFRTKYCKTFTYKNLHYIACLFVM